MATTLAARRLSPALFAQISPLRIQFRAMSSATEKHHFLVLIPDKPGVKDLRMSVRSQHLEDLKPKIESGLWKMGGALLNDLAPTPDSKTWDFHGSTLVVLADSKKEVLEQLNNDIYVKSGVWDAEKAQIFPLKIAFGL